MEWLAYENLKKGRKKTPFKRGSQEEKAFLMLHGMEN